MKTFFRKKTKKRMKRAFFLFMAIIFFCQSIYPSFGIARTSLSSINDEIYYSEDSRVDLASEMELATGVEIKPEANKEVKQEYDPQPETEEDVQGWIDRYLESENDESEKPVWEKEVDEELVPEGWKVELVEDGDESFDRDYYTIFLDYDEQPEKIEEVREWIEIYVESDLDEHEKPKWEEEVEEDIVPNGWEIELVEEDEEFDGEYYTFSVDYDAQPETIEEVQEWTDQYVESDDDEKELPNWEKDVDEGILPAGWAMTFVEGGDENFEADYYTLLVDYSAQPKTIEEVQKWIKEYTESDNDKSKLPNWEKDVDKGILPAGWVTTFVEGGDENFEADYYTLLVDYDAQPETIEEVQKWMKEYVDSDNDKSKLPNWEKDVDKGILPAGWVTRFVEGGDENFEADYYTLLVDYDAQPETIKEVQEWINKYVDSENDPSERPNWEKDVDKELLPEGWEIKFIEGGDESFEADYYTISQLGEESEEEVEAEKPEEEVEKEVEEEVETEESEEEAFEYDPQPTTKEEVQEWVDKYTDSNYNPSAKPHWESDVEKDLMPKNWKTDFVEGGDEHFGLDFYTIFPNAMAMADIPLVVATSDALQAAIDGAASGDVIIISSNIDFSDTVTIPAGKMITIQSADSANPVTLTMNKAGKRHFKVYGNLTLQNIILDGGKTAGGVDVLDGGIFTMDSGAIIQNCYAAERGGGVYAFDNSIFNLKGNAEVKNNESGAAGGGVYIGRHSRFNLSDTAKISGNYTEDRGGGLAILQSYFKMSGGEISDNASNDKGGGVIVAYGVIEISAGDIINNKTKNEGGGLYVGMMKGDPTLVDHSYTPGELKDGTGVIKTNLFDMSGGTIKGNESILSGGGVFVGGVIDTKDGPIARSIFNMSGGIIEDNHTKTTVTEEDVNSEEWAAQVAVAGLSNGGGVAIIYSEFNLNGDSNGSFGGTPKITLNTASHIGGGVFVDDDSIAYMHEGAEISWNETKTWDGGILIHNESKFEMHGGEIINNTSVFNGGGVGIVSSDFVMSGGLIAANQTTATTAQGVATGAGVMVGRSDILGVPAAQAPIGTFTMTGGVITGNHAVDAGGGVSVEDASEFTMTGGMIGDGFPENSGVTPLTILDETGKEILLTTGNRTADRAGGVNVQDGSTFTMTNGEILENKSENAGGGVVITNNSKFFMGDEQNRASSTPLITKNATVRTADATSNPYAGGVGISASEFYMYSGEISENHAALAGGGVAIGYGSKFTLDGGTITNNTTESYGGGVVIGDRNFQKPTDPGRGSQFIMESGEISDNHTALQGGGVVISSSTFAMSGGEITDNSTKNAGGGVWVGSFFASDDPSTFTMSGGSIKNNTTKDPDAIMTTQEGRARYFSVGGGVMINNGSTFTMNNASGKDPVISGNTSYHHGGGVHVQGNSRFTMEQGNISGNASSYAGGGVYVGYQDFVIGGNAATMDNSVFTMKSGTIDRNKTVYDSKVDNRFLYGGGIHVDKATFNMEGGTVSNNVAAFSGGGVSIASSNFNMSGGDISGNMTDISQNKGELAGNQALTYGGGVWVGRSYSRANADQTPKSTFDMSGGTIGGAGYFDKNKVNNGGNSGKGNYASESGGGVYISRGVTFNMYGTAEITFNQTDRRGGGVYTSHGSEWTSGTDNGGSYLATRDGSKFNLGKETGGGAPKISNNKADFAGGGVYVGTGTVFHMWDGAEITGNSTNDRGGGVALLQSYFYMHGGKISDNKSVDRGGALTNVYSIFEMTGGEITGNTTDNTAGGVYMGANTGGASDFKLDPKYTPKELTDPGDENYKGAPHYFLLDGGTISNNRTNAHTVRSGEGYYSTGGGVAIDSGSRFDMKSGAISENQSWHHGGGVYVQSKSKFNMDGGTISNNTSNYAGGGVYVGYKDFVVDGDPANWDDSEFVMTGGKIEGNETTYHASVGRRWLYGGGVHIDKAHFTMSGTAEISNNLAAFSGGGVSIASGTFDMTGGEISGNITDSTSIEEGIENVDPTSLYTDGGGVWVGRSYYRANPDAVPFSTFNMSGGTIGGTGYHSGKNDGTNAGKGNYANESGGGVYLSRGVIFNMYGTAEIKSNHTDNRGGGVYASWGSDWSASYSSPGSKPAARVPSKFYLNGKGVLNEDGTIKSVTQQSGAPKISDNRAESAGGGVYIAEQSELHMWDGAEITRNATEDRGGGVGILQSYFYMNGGKISDNNSKQRGGGVTVVLGIFEMRGGSITGNATEDLAGGVNIGNATGPDLTIYPDRTPKELASKYGGATSYFLMDGENAIISDNTAKNSGGGAAIRNGSKFDMKKGTISKNKTNEFAGGVAVQLSELNMSGGTITENVSYKNGGGVTVENSIFEMSGGTISKNRTTWIQIERKVGNNTTIIEGTVDATGKITDGTGAEVILDSATDKIKDGAGAGGVWVSYDKTITDMVEPKGDGSYFHMFGATSKISENTSVASAGGVSIEDGSLFEMEDGMINKNRTMDAGGGVSVQQASTFNMSGGSIRENESEFTGAGVYVIDGNRYENNGATHDTKPPTTKPSTFNMSGGTIDSNKTTSSLTLDQLGASAAGVANLANGGGVAIVRSVFNFNGNGGENGKFSPTNGPFPNGAGTPTISNNSAQHIGGGVFADDYSEVNMYSGAKISGNSTRTWDGGILIHWKSEFYMYGGDITNNTSYFNGGGVGIISSEFYMYDGNIIGNSTTSPTDSTGGGVMIGGSDIVAGGLNHKSYWEMHGGTIAKNTAINSGGGASIEDGSEFQMLGGTIGASEGDKPNIYDEEVEEQDPTTGGYVRFTNGNSTVDFGGGVNVQDGSEFVMDGGSIRGNYSGSAVPRTGGGGVFVGMGSAPNGVTGTFTMNGGKISENASNRAGGGVYIHNQAEFILNDGEIVDNRADSNIRTNKASIPDPSDGGGGIFVLYGKLTMNNGVVSRNQTWSYESTGATGGGIALLDRATFTMEHGAIISDNFAEHGGGGVLLNENNTFNMYGGEIVRNTADGGDETFMSGGGGVYLFRQNWFNMYDGKINNNTAGKDGGGVAVNYPRIGGGFDSPNDSVINMYGGEINNNNVEGRNQHASQGYGGGGGVYIFQGTTFNMIKQEGKKAPEIKNNTAGFGADGKHSPYGTDGGGIYVSRGTLNVIGGIIDGNTAVGNGGGIFARAANAGATNIVNINNPATDKNFLVGQGIDSGIEPDFGSASFITNNTAGGDGGGIYVAAAYNLYNPDGYKQLTTGETTVFDENRASTLYNPPGDDDPEDDLDGFTSLDGRTYFNKDYPNIEFDDAYVSEWELLKSVHPLNNYDINFRNPPAISVFTFFKVDAAQGTKMLADAVFQLYKEEGGVRYYYFDADYVKNSINWLKQETDGTLKELDAGGNWVETAKTPNHVSASNGQVAFPNLEEGDYTLVEVKAPDGYQLPTGHWNFTWEVAVVTIGVDTDSNGTIDIYEDKEMGRIKGNSIQAEGTAPAFKNVGTADNPIYQVGNIRNFKLPLTGNGGFYWLVALGLLLVAAGTTRVIYNRRKKSQDSPG